MLLPHPTPFSSHLNIDNTSLKSNNGLGRNREYVESKALTKPSSVLGRPSSAKSRQANALREG